MEIALAVLLIISALVVIYYWADFFIRGGVNVIKEDWYIKFERAFPPADIWMAICALLGAIGLLTGQAYALLFLALAAGSLLFLALMDITFNVQNRLYRLVATSNEMRFELLLNVWALGLGIGLIVYLWPRMAFV